MVFSSIPFDAANSLKLRIFRVRRFRVPVSPGLLGLASASTYLNRGFCAAQDYALAVVRYGTSFTSLHTEMVILRVPTGARLEPQFAAGLLYCTLSFRGRAKMMI